MVKFEFYSQIGGSCHVQTKLGDSGWILGYSRGFWTASVFVQKPEKYLGAKCGADNDFDNYVNMPNILYIINNWLLYTLKIFYTD